MNLALVDNKENSSPFDSIKRIDSDGEYWLGRELMPLLGYEQWRRFAEAIDRASASLKASNSNPFDHIVGTGKMIETGKGAQRRIEEYRLTRLGSYMVAMNGDPRKPQVAAAQSYFAVKTREAEVIIPLQNEQLEILKLQNQNLTLENSVAQSQLALLQFRHTISLTCPELVQQKVLGYQVIEKPEYIERTITPDGEVCEGVGITYIQKRYGFKSTKEAWGWLDRIGMGKFSKIWKSEKKIVEASVIPRDCLIELDTLFEESPRQMFLGE